MCNAHLSGHEIRLQTIYNHLDFSREGKKPHTLKVEGEDNIYTHFNVQYLISL